VTPDLLGTIGVFVSAAISTAGFIAFVTLARFWRSRGGWHVGTHVVERQGIVLGREQPDGVDTPTG